MALDFVVFSKDRPAQLELLLRSVKRFVSGWDELGLSVIHLATDERYARGYEIARGLHPEHRWIDERATGSTFRELTLAELGRRPYTAFLMDDQLFKAPFSVAAPELALLGDDPELLCLSLRMDPGMDYCYAFDQQTGTPPFERGTVWRWTDADGDWGYPMSLDAHVFRTEQIAARLAELHFENPNTMEAALAAAPLDPPLAVCLPVAPTVNVPANRVQSVCDNRYGGGDPGMLNAQFLAGRRLALDPLEGVRTSSPHCELELTWEPGEHAAEWSAQDVCVSVVIPCFNYGHHLEEAVESVLRQHVAGVEILIVDDGSTDDTVDVARRLIAGQPSGRIRLLHQANSGGNPAHPRNTGIAATRGEFVLCLDADDRLAPGFLERCVGALETDPAAGFAYGDQHDFGGRVMVHRTPPYDFSRLVVANFLSISSVFRREVWELVGGYDADVVYEDWDFWIACGAAGRHGIKVDGAVFEYRVKDDGRWSDIQLDDHGNKAALVLKRPQLYSEAQLAWARGVLAGAPEALAASTTVGVIPSFAEPPSAVEEAGTRSFVTVGFADEVMAHPELVAAYARRFGGDDDATLVIFAPDGEPDELGDRLRPVLAAVGCDRPDGPDLLGLAVPASSGEELVANQAQAVLSRRPADGPLALLERFDDGSVDQLRSLAERTWHRPAEQPRLQRSDITSHLGSDVEAHPWFLDDLDAYQSLPAAEPLALGDLNPQLHDRTETSPFDGHYFYQDVWAARHVADARPGRHVDVGSRVDYVGFLTSHTNVEFVDIRPLGADMDRLTCVTGSVLDLPYAERSLESVSCLHVAEHIGLGRYGDPLDPLGTIKAAAELQRVVAPGGQLLFALPVGRARVCFNAHRIHSPHDVVAMFPELELVEFSGVDDGVNFARHRSLDDLADANYACGMFRFVRPAPATVPGPAPLAVTAPPVPDAPTDAAKREHLLSLFRRRNHRLLIESGTYLGGTVEFFLPHAERIISIEVEPGLHEAARERFAGQASVELLLGDALDILPALVAGAALPPLVWLDGHFSGGVTGCGAEVEPAPTILERLATLHVPAGTSIVIDDLRLFGRDDTFPGLDELIAMARRAFPAGGIYLGLDSLVIEV